MTVPPRFLRVHSLRHNPSTKKNSKYVAACLLVIMVLIRWVIRAVRNLFVAAEHAMAK